MRASRSTKRGFSSLLRVSCNELINSEPDRTNPDDDVTFVQPGSSERTSPPACCNLLSEHLRTAAQVDAAPHRQRDTDKSSRGTKTLATRAFSRARFHLRTKAPKPQRSAAELRASMMLHNSERRGGGGGVRRRSQLMRRGGGRKPRDGTARGDSETILRVFKPPFAGHLTSCIFHAFGEGQRRDQSGHCDRDDIGNESRGGGGRERGFMRKCVQSISELSCDDCDYY